MDRRRIPLDHPLASALTTAIQTGALATLEELFADEAGLPDAWIVDEHGTRKTLVHVATDWPAKFPDVEATLRWLAARGCPIDEPALKTDGSAPETPLHWAVSADDVVATRTLLDLGHDLEATGAVFTGGTAMSDAVVFRQWNAARVLLDAGATTTPWQAAALGLDDRLRDALPGLGGGELHSCLWHAARAGHLSTCRLALDAGADPAWLGPMGWTPRQAAQDGGDAAVIDLLDAG